MGGGGGTAAATPGVPASSAAASVVIAKPKTRFRRVGMSPTSEPSLRRSRPAANPRSAYTPGTERLRSDTLSNCDIQPHQSPVIST
ncbi:hypothetical protein GCM10010452_45180 [Crossiella cryophila]